MFTSIIDQNEPSGAQMKLVTSLLVKSGAVKEAEFTFPGVNSDASTGDDGKDITGTQVDSNTHPSKTTMASKGPEVCPLCSKKGSECHCEPKKPEDPVEPNSGAAGDADRPLGSKIAAKCFADKIFKLWPIDSDADIFKSAASIELQSHSMMPGRIERVRNTLNERAMLFGCFSKVATIREFVQSQIGPTKQAASVVYALPDIHRFPISDANQVLESAEYFTNVRCNYSYELRKQAAAGILDAATKFSVVLDDKSADQLEASAGRGIGNPIKIARALAFRGRKALATSTYAGLSLLKSAVAVIKNSDNYDVAGLMDLATKSAAAMDQVDVQFGFDKLYGYNMEFPEDAAFFMTAVKAANTKNKMVVVGNEVYWRHDIEKISPKAFNVISDGMSEKIASGDKTDPDKLSKLAYSDQTFNRVLHGFGLRNVSNPPVETDRTGDAGKDLDVRTWERIAAENGGKLIPQTDFTFPLNHKDRVVFPEHRDAAGVAY
jgi:hypothetical protein